MLSVRVKESRVLLRSEGHDARAFPTSSAPTRLPFRRSRIPDAVTI